MKNLITRMDDFGSAFAADGAIFQAIKKEIMLKMYLAWL